MNILDSSCWLEFAENSLIGISVEPIIADKKHLLVPTVVLYEVFKKLSSMEGSGYANSFIRGMLTAEVVPCIRSRYFPFPRRFFLVPGLFFQERWRGRSL